VGRPGTDPNPLPGEDMRGNLGDYGILYNIRVKIQNPHPTPQKVEVAFGPEGGPVMGVFTVGGRYLEVNEVYPPNTRSITHLMLRPNETRVVDIQTVPLGGWTYPVNVIVR